MQAFSKVSVRFQYQLILLTQGSLVCEVVYMLTPLCVEPFIFKCHPPCFLLGQCLFFTFLDLKKRGTLKEKVRSRTVECLEHGDITHHSPLSLVFVFPFQIMEQNKE